MMMLLRRPVTGRAVGDEKIKSALAGGDYSDVTMGRARGGASREHTVSAAMVEYGVARESLAARLQREMMLIAECSTCSPPKRLQEAEHQDDDTNPET
ncbi:hypothetical protein R1sor_013443 [Riccia sorocarpa]|uniref:Uncharacterized protein n=1 Tax=Riccia sorocarpa TaxID=122646 RepID=A0ABD3H9E4_9MARC